MLPIFHVNPGAHWSQVDLFIINIHWVLRWAFYTICHTRVALSVEIQVICCWLNIICQPVAWLIIVALCTGFTVDSLLIILKATLGRNANKANHWVVWGTLAADQSFCWDLTCFTSLCTLVTRKIGIAPLRKVAILTIGHSTPILPVADTSYNNSFESYNIH